MTGEDFERSPAAGLLADFARRKLLRLHESARETLALCEGENGPLHYAGGLRHGCAADGGIWRRLRRRAIRLCTTRCMA